MTLTRHALLFLGLGIGLATVRPALASEVDVAALVGLSPDAVALLDDGALAESRGAGVGDGLIGAVIGLTTGVVAGVAGAVGSEPGTGGGLVGGIEGLIDALGQIGPMNIVMAQIGDSTVTHIGIDTQSISITQGGTTVALCAGACGATVSLGQSQ